jgi:hypothetical protein
MPDGIGRMDDRSGPAVGTKVIPPDLGSGDARGGNLSASGGSAPYQEPSARWNLRSWDSGVQSTGSLGAVKGWMTPHRHASMNAIQRVTVLLVPTLAPAPIIPSPSLDAANSDQRFYAAGGAVRRAVTAANAVTAPESERRIAAVT